MGLGVSPLSKTFLLFYVTTVSLRQEHVVGNLNTDRRVCVDAKKSQGKAVLATVYWHLTPAFIPFYTIPQGNTIYITRARGLGTTFPRLLSQLGYTYSQFSPRKCAHMICGRLKRAEAILTLVMVTTHKQSWATVAPEYKAATYDFSCGFLVSEWQRQLFRPIDHSLWQCEPHPSLQKMWQILTLIPPALLRYLPSPNSLYYILCLKYLI